MVEIPDKEYRNLQARLKEMGTAAAESKPAEKRLLKPNECFLNFGRKPLENINNLTAYAGDGNWSGKNEKT